MSISQLEDALECLVTKTDPVLKKEIETIFKPVHNQMWNQLSDKQKAKFNKRNE